MEKIINRLKKINGQISGIIKMIEEGQDCEKILIQFLAVKSALESALAENLNHNLQKCLQQNDQELSSKIIKIMTKTK